MYGFKQSFNSTLNLHNSPNCSVYPNPSVGVFNLKLNNPGFINSIEVVNTKGQTVFINNKPNNADIVIDITNQQKGIYVLLVSTQTGVETYKLLKN